MASTRPQNLLETPPPHPKRQRGAIHRQRLWRPEERHWPKPCPITLAMQPPQRRLQPWIRRKEGRPRREHPILPSPVRPPSSTSSPNAASKAKKSPPAAGSLASAAAVWADDLARVVWAGWVPCEEATLVGSMFNSPGPRCDTAARRVHRSVFGLCAVAAG